MRGRWGALLVALVLVCTGCDWLQWGGGPAHSGTNGEVGLTTSSVGGLISSTMTQLPATSPAAIANGLAFVERDGKLTAFDTATYAVVWTAALPAGATAGGAPAVDSGSHTVFVAVSGATNPVLVGFDSDGVKNCNTLLNTCSPTFSASLGIVTGPATPPLVDGGRVFANGGNSLFAFDAGGLTNCTTSLGTATCTPLWSASTNTSTLGVGPAASGGTLYDVVNTGSSLALRAFDESAGTVLWTAPVGASPVTATPAIALDGTLFLPVSTAIEAFAGGGCGASTCSPAFSLAPKTGDAAGTFLGTPAIDGSQVFATNSNGMLYEWPRGGCGASTCQPAYGVGANTPVGGSTTYSQSPVTTGDMVFLLADRAVSGANHIQLIALDETNGNQLASWDLKPGGFGAGLANASIADGVIYAPVDSAVFAVHPPQVQPLASLTVSPLALSPAFAPTTFDYVVPCASGTNSLTIAMSAVAGGSAGLIAPVTTQPTPSQTDSVTLSENQAAVVQATDPAGGTAQYWIRCLPHDFPVISVARHPSVGTPTPGWYVMGNGKFAMVLNSDLTPVWYRRGTPNTTNVTALSHDTIAYLPNPFFAGFGTDPNGAFNVFNLDANTTSQIMAVGMPTDIHELYTLPNGDHLLLAYPLKSGVDLTGLPGNPPPGQNSTIADGVIQEINPQGQLVWQWRASDHIDPVQESTNPQKVTLNNQTVYDVFHLNSIDVNANGDLLVSGRHLNAVFYVQQSTGTIVWKMGGKPFSKDGAAIIGIQNDPDGGIIQQHDARFLPNGDISMFDDQDPAKSIPARGVEFALDLAAKTAQPVFSFSSPDGVPSCCQGSFRRYSDGDSVIGWGLVSFSNGRAFTEIDAQGNDLLDVGLTPGTASYRAVKVPPPRFDVDVLRRTAGQ